MKCLDAVMQVGELPSHCLSQHPQMTLLPHLIGVEGP